jgi:hypothetical protein
MGAPSRTSSPVGLDRWKERAPRARWLRAGGGLVLVVAVLTVAAPQATAKPVDKSAQATLCGGGGSVDNSVSCNSAFKGAVDIPKTIADNLAGMAAKQLAGFAFREVGLGDLVDPTGAKLTELKQQLEAISRQIDTLQLSVNQMESELKKIALEGKINSITDPLAQIQSLYNDYFRLALDALTDYADQELAVATADPPQTCDQFKSCVLARGIWEDKRSKFLDAMDPVQVASLNGVLHNAIVGVGGIGALPRLYGDYLMAGPGSDGFLRASDSEKLFSFTSFFTEQEALATFMKAQWQSTRLNSTQFEQFLQREVTDWHTQEAALLPAARIPANTVIALPVNPGDRTTTIGRPMLTWKANAAQSLGLPLRWDPSAPAGARGDVATALPAFNTTAGGGLTGWHVPSKAEWDAILAGRFGAYPYDARGFLGRVFAFPNSDPVSAVSLLNALDSTKLIWTSGAPRVLNCGWADTIGGTGFNLYGTITDYAHTALPTTPTLRTYPTGYTETIVPNLGSSVAVEVRGGLTKAAGLQACRDVLAARVTAGFTAGAAATLIPVRTTAEKWMP